MKTALITGGSGAIGKALVSEFSEEFRVVFTYSKNRNRAEEIAALYGAEAVKCDQTRQEDVNGLLSRLSSCDLLINNAGISSTKLFTEHSEEEMCGLINTNLLGAMRVTKAVLPLMLKEKSGCIINVSSIWGVYGGSCEVVYSAAKAGLIGFTKALSREVGCSGVRVNCIAPGMIESEMNGHLSEEEIREFVSCTSLEKIGRPEDVARAARYLLEAEFVTGQVFGVDGGF